MEEAILPSGAVQRVNSTDTYTVGTDCSLRLSFLPGGTGLVAGGVTGPFAPPSVFGGLLVDNTSGIIGLQPASGFAPDRGPFRAIRGDDSLTVAAQ
jgi:hypothetical protein